MVAYVTSIINLFYIVVFISVCLFFILYFQDYYSSRYDRKVKRIHAQKRRSLDMEGKRLRKKQKELDREHRRVLENLKNKSE
jgi:ABC-type multidrug transport system fused ATPase/permease subunit